MKASQRSLTRVDILVIVLIVLFVLLLFFWISFTPVHEEARKVNCRKNLYQIGKALAAYREDNGGYFPFSWQRAGEPEPVGDGSANAAMAATSLGNLYPRYVITTRIFKCPSAADEPSFVLNLPLAYRGAGQAAGLAGALPHGSNWTLTGDFPLLLTSMSPMRASSYGYDPRISPGAPDGDVVMADWDGSWQLDHDTTSQNHDGGQNVLFVDGRVKWKETNLCSGDPIDNIYAEDKWNADTDSYLVDSDAGLGVSFDGYKHLHYPR